MKKIFVMQIFILFLFININPAMSLAPKQNSDFLSYPFFDELGYSVSEQDIIKVSAFYGHLKQKTEENNEFFQKQLENVLENIKTHYAEAIFKDMGAEYVKKNMETLKGSPEVTNALNKIFKGFCRNYYLGDGLSEVKVLKEMMLYDFTKRFFYGKRVKTEIDGVKSDVAVSFESILLGSTAGLLGRWLDLSDGEKIEKMTDLYSTILELPDHGKRFFRVLYGKYLAKDELLVIGDNFLPSCLLDEGFEKKWLGSVELEDVQQYKDASKEAIYWAMPMLGGIGSSVKRTRYLSRIKSILAGETVTITDKELQDKSSDLFFNMTIRKADGTEEERYISIMEAKLIKLILEVEASEYKDLIFEMRKDLWALVKDKQYVFDEKGRSYEEYINEELISKGKFKMTFAMARMGQFPSVLVPANADKDKKIQYLSADNRAPVGHAAFGIGVLLNAYDGNLKDIDGNPIDTIGSPFILGLYNGDGVNNRVDSSMVGYMSAEKVAMAIVSTDKTGLDKKGGQIGVRCVNPSAEEIDRIYVPQIMELAQAKKKLTNGKTQETRFYGIGITEGKRLGKQKFNTNSVLFNMGQLTPFLQEMGEIVGKKIFKDKHNRTPDMSREGDRQEVMALGRGYLIEVATPDLIANPKEKNGQKFVQLEGALSSQMMNFAAFVDTHPDKQIQDLKAKYFGEGPFLRFINVPARDRTGYFTPEKVSIDHWLQAESGRFRFNTDPNVWALEDLHPEKPLPIIDIPDAFYTDLENCHEAFVNLDITDLEKWGIRGKVKLDGFTLKGRIEILNTTDTLVDLSRFKDLLINKYGVNEDFGNLVLEDLCIVVDQNDIYVFPVDMNEEKDLNSNLVEDQILEAIEDSPLNAEWGHFVPLDVPIFTLKLITPKKGDSAEKINRSIEILSKVIYSRTIPYCLKMANISHQEILLPQTQGVDGRGEITMFFKPESLRLPQFFEKVMKSFLLDNGAVLTGMRAMNSAYLKQNGIVERHYGVINQAAKNASWLGKERVQKIAETFSVPQDHVVGGLEAISKINEILKEKAKPEITITDLELAQQWAKAKGEFKTGPGIYTRALEFNGEKFAIVNAFHISQMENFYSEGRGILAVTLQLSPDFEIKQIRETTGNNNPSLAADDTFRKYFLDVYPEASTLKNGIHVSAGYLEGLREMNNIMRVHLPESGVYATLKAKGYSEREISKVLRTLMENPEMYNSQKGETERVFDITEEASFKEVIDFVEDLIKNGKAVQPKIGESKIVKTSL